MTPTLGVRCANAREFDHDISVHAPGVDVGSIRGDRDAGGGGDATETAPVAGEGGDGDGF